MKNLIELYRDHRGNVSDKWFSYLSEYERIFTVFRDRPVRMLEIGVQNGGSLEIWSKFFQNAQVLVGCDINPDCAKLVYDDPRIKVVVADANTDAAEVEILGHSSQFDVIIDDGSHTSSDIIKSFSRYFRHLSQEGIYIAEDLHCSYWQEFEGGLYYPYASISFFKRLADIVNHEHWGIEKDRKKLLQGFSEQFQVEFDEVDLAQIHSIEFLNSVCVVHKREVKTNLLGERVIAGQDELVVSGLRALSSEPLNQSSNQWSTMTVAADENYESMSKAAAKRDLEIANLIELLDEKNAQISSLKESLFERDCEIVRRNQDLAENEVQIVRINQLLEDRDSQIAFFNQLISHYEEQKTNLENIIQAIYLSTSWRFAAPLRWAKLQMIRAQRLAHLPKQAMQLGGGYKPTLQKAMNLYRRDGMLGIKRGVHFVYSSANREKILLTEGPDGAAVAIERNDYSKWVERYDTLNEAVRDDIRNKIGMMEKLPLISIVMPTYNANHTFLVEAIESVRGQLYPNWELCIADDASLDPIVRPLLEKYASEDARIKLVFREKNGHISAASNSALQLASGEWVALLDHDDLLAEHALYCVADSINNNPTARLIYSDEDKIDEHGHRYNPYFKCSWNRDLFYSHNMFCHLSVYNKPLLEKIGGFRLGFEGAQDYDLALRYIEEIDESAIYHIPKVLYHWRVHGESTAGGSEAKPYALQAGQRAIEEHLERIGVGGTVEQTRYGYRVLYDLPSKLPLVSLIIPTRNGLQLIRQCIESIADKTKYSNYEIIVVDNGSDDPDILQYFAAISEQDNIRVLRDERPFNFSALNNAAVDEAKGELVCLVNNDIEVISPDWLSEMVRFAIQPGIGAVGAKLLYPNNTLQHAGVVLGIGGVAGHSHKYLGVEDNGYFSRTEIVSAYSAVTAACLLIKKSIYQEVGGLNEESLAIAFNDVDFCLRVREAGYRNVWTPYAELYHHESATRGSEDNPLKQARFASEVNYMVKRWGDKLVNDPAYSPNLSLEFEDFSLAWPPRTEPLFESAFDEDAYLTSNSDVRIAVQDGVFQSGLDHFEKFGRSENRTSKVNLI